MSVRRIYANQFAYKERSKMVTFLTEREAVYCKTLLDEFEGEGYLPRLCQSIRERGLNIDAMPFLFELRYAKALKNMAITPAYEVKNLGESTVDFVYRSQNKLNVFAELVSIRASDRTQNAIETVVDEYGVEWRNLLLSTGGEDPALSEEGEVILVQQKICEKVFRDGNPIKFKTPEETCGINLIVIDMRGFLAGNGGDHQDALQLTLGNPSVAALEKRFINDRDILGLFQPTERPRGAPTLRERVHAILFTHDTLYVDGSLLDSATFIANPHLIHSKKEWCAAYGAVMGRPRIRDRLKKLRSWASRLLQGKVL